MLEFDVTQGKLFVLFGPSGCGKTTLKKLICERLPEEKLQPVVTTTTRKPRAGEVDGVDYFFIDQEEFEGLCKAGLFFEYTKFLDNYYATPYSEINFLNLGKNLIITVELDGLKRLAEFKNAVLIFVTAEADELSARVLKRAPGADAQAIEQRLALDAQQIHEATQNITFNYTLINQDLSAAVNVLEKIIHQEIG